MQRRAIRMGGLGLLAAVFTVGLAFATVELPYLVDGFLQSHVTTPGGDSHASDIAQLKTELFIAHFHLRAIGYTAFTALVALIVVGFARRRTGLATLGALGVMLTVFAQFASVMFFLAGLGALNVLWLPVLDLSFDIAGLGQVIRAPYDGARWLLGALGVENTYWPVVLFVIGAGLLIFFLGTLAWLGARARNEEVASGWIYRVSRHPQYLGWIIWTYGVYLLLLRAQYPRRSWGIDASLPWVVSTMIILGVALMEEMNMRRRHGEAYESYRRSAPFLFPLPRFVERIFVLPLRALFRKDRFERSREVAVVLGLYTVLIMGASAWFYGQGLRRALIAVSPFRDRGAVMAGLVTQIREEENWRVQSALAGRLAGFGQPSLPYLLELLGDEDPEIREYGAQHLYDVPSMEAVPALVAALEDPSEDVRGNAVHALQRTPCPEAVEALTRVLDTEESWVRTSAIHSLARLGEGVSLEPAAQLLDSPHGHVRISGAEALGLLGSSEAIPFLARALEDDSSGPGLRRAAVIALLQIGSSDALPILERATEDEDWEVRLYAAEAVKRIR